MRVDDAVARVIGAANPNAPTWQTETVNALTTAAFAGEAVRDRGILVDHLRPDLATIREHYTAAKAGNEHARNTILDACDNVQATIERHLGPNWTPEFGTTGAQFMGLAARHT